MNTQFVHHSLLTKARHLPRRIGNITDTWIPHLIGWTNGENYLLYNAQIKKQVTNCTNPPAGSSATKLRGKMENINHIALDGCKDTWKIIPLNGFTFAHVTHAQNTESVGKYKYMARSAFRLQTMHELYVHGTII